MTTNFDRAAERFGAVDEELAAIPYLMPTSLAAELDGLRTGTWSRYWELPDDLRQRVAETIESELLAAGAILAEPLHISIKQRILVATQFGS